MSLYTIHDIYSIPIEQIIRYVKSHYPATLHFYATEPELRYLAVVFMDQEGLLTPHDSYVFHQPYFGQLYTATGGNTLLATEEFFFNMLPGVDYLGYL